MIQISLMIIFKKIKALKINKKNSNNKKKKLNNKKKKLSNKKKKSSKKVNKMIYLKSQKIN